MPISGVLNLKLENAVPLPVTCPLKPVTSAMPPSSSVLSKKAPRIPINEIRNTLIFAFAAGCASCFFFFASAAVQHDRKNGTGAVPTGTILLAAGFLLLPFLVSYFLLSSEKDESNAAGAGIAGTMFGLLLLSSPYAILGIALFVGLSAWNGPPDLGLVAAGIALLVFFAASVRIAWLSYLIGKLQWRFFGLAACATAIYFYVGPRQLKAVAYKSQQQAERQRVQKDMKLNMPGELARQKVMQVTACLLRSHMQNPTADYPESLDQLPAGCNLQSGDLPPEFTFSYAAQNDSSGQASDFRLTAIPKMKGVLGRNPLLSDSRGIVFVYYPWEMEGATPQVMAMPSDREYSQIDALKSNVEKYIQEKNNGVAPDALDPQSMGSLGHEIPTIEDAGKRLETRDFRILYLASGAANPGQFALSVECKSYGQNCLRSFFSDYDGTLHATGEPRAATTNDPPPLMCEKVSSECEEVTWQVP